MGVRFNVKWLLAGLALSLVLTLAVRALTGVWFLGFFLFLPFGFSFGTRNLGGGASPRTSADPFDPPPPPQDELRRPG